MAEPRLLVLSGSSNNETLSFDKTGEIDGFEIIESTT